MSLNHQIARRRLRRKGPLAQVCALLTACCVWMIGASMGLDPHIVLWRSIVSALLIGVIVSFGLSVIYVANTTRG